MSNDDFIKNAKEEYKKIGHVECPAFDNERIYFNRKGFQHLLYKKGDRRNKSDQRKRLALIKDAVRIIKQAQSHGEYRVDRNAKFWSFVQDKITVVVCQINKGPKYFLSVMSKRKSTKAP